MSTLLNISDKIKLESVTPPYFTLLNYATAQGYSLPSAGQQVVQQQLISDLQSAGIWDKLDALYIMANDGSREFGRLNWVSPSTFELSELPSAPTFTLNEGFSGGNGLDTGITLDTDTTHFSTTNKEGSFGGWSYYTKFAGSPALMGTDQYYNGMRGGTNDNIMKVSVGNGNLLDGLYHLNAYPNGSLVTAEQYQNASVVTTQNGTPETYTSATMHLLSEGGTSQFSLDTISIAFVGGDLSAEASDLYNAFNTYMSAI